MAIPVQCLPLDSGPPLPKPGGTHALGTNRDMFNSSGIYDKWVRHLRTRDHVDQKPLEATDNESTDDLGNVHLRTPATAPGRCSPPPSGYNHVGHREPGPEHTHTSTSSIVNGTDASSSTSSQTPTVVVKRSRARYDSLFEQGRPHKNTSGRQIWTSDDSVHAKTPQKQGSFAKAYRPMQSTPRPIPDEDKSSKMMRQLETRPISQDQLVAEVKGIYAGLVMVETKCIEVDHATSSNIGTDDNSRLNNEQWQALIALHRTLLHEHHDFFLASQHPAANPALRRLATKYAMPARMWRHGIHSFLELLRHRLPTSLEYMLTYLYSVYSMMALLYEIVPAFEDTWIECLGDLGRYRMSLEDDDIRDREIWDSVNRHWCSKASDKSPTTRRLYHHLAILARPNALQQSDDYAKQLCVPLPSRDARRILKELLDRLGLPPDRPQHLEAFSPDDVTLRLSALCCVRISRNLDDRSSSPKLAIEKLFNLPQPLLACWDRVEQEAKQHAIGLHACNLSKLQCEPWVTNAIRAFHFARSYFAKFANAVRQFGGAAEARKRSLGHKMTGSRGYLPIAPSDRASCSTSTAYRAK